MDQVQYERWKQHLEAEWEAAAEQIRAGFLSQMRILDQVRVAFPERGDAVAATKSPPSPARPAALPASVPASPAAAPPPAASPAPEPQPERQRRPAGELLARVFQALDDLPEVFDRSDLLALLDPKPSRGSLYQVLQNLLTAGWIECLKAGTGTKPSRYRKINPPEDEAEEG